MNESDYGSLSLYSTLLSLVAREFGNYCFVTSSSSSSPCIIFITIEREHDHGSDLTGMQPSPDQQPQKGRRTFMSNNKKSHRPRNQLRHQCKCAKVPFPRLRVGRKQAGRLIISCHIGSVVWHFICNFWLLIMVDRVVYCVPYEGHHINWTYMGGERG